MPFLIKENNGLIINPIQQNPFSILRKMLNGFYLFLEKKMKISGGEIVKSGNLSGKISRSNLPP